MGASKNADFVSSAFGGNQKPHVRSVDRSIAQPSPDAKEIVPVEDAKASKEEIEEKRTKAIEEHAIKPSDADKDTFVSKGVHHKDTKKKKEEAEEEDESKKEDKKEEKPVVKKEEEKSEVEDESEQ